MGLHKKLAQTRVEEVMEERLVSQGAFRDRAARPPRNIGLLESVIRFEKQPMIYHRSSISKNHSGLSSELIVKKYSTNCDGENSWRKSY